VTQVADVAVWDGTNPSPQGFGAVVLLDGINGGAGSEMPVGGQTALVNYVNQGGGLILTEWMGLEVLDGRYGSMQSLVPLSWGDYAEGQFTYSVVQSHPVTSGVSSAFNVTSAADLGSVNSGTAVVTSSGGTDGGGEGPGAGSHRPLRGGGNYRGYQPFLVRTCSGCW